MKIYSRFDRPPSRSVTCPTITNVCAYDPVKKELVKVGERNIQAFINAPAADCSIYAKINRYLAGDFFALGNGSAKGVYTDVSGMPTDINSMHALIKDVSEKIKAFGKADIPSFLDILTSTASSSNSDETPTIGNMHKNNTDESEVNSDA